MKKYKIILKLKSDVLIGSGSGFGATIDSDIIFDSYGLPYIPAKRIKGCLVDSFNQVETMFALAGIQFNGNKQLTFGVQGQEHPAEVYFENLYLKNYENIKQWMEYLSYKDNYPEIFNLDSILSLMTHTRSQTTIDNGVAKDTSLRKQRVLTKGLEFIGNIDILSNNPHEIENTLSLACRNLKSLGTKRNRGLGEISCTIKSNENENLMETTLKKMKEVANG